MSHPQNVQYNSQNMMYISQIFYGVISQDPLLLTYSLHDRNKRIVSNLCTSINKVNLY